jgi:hypothetical protein
MVQLKAKIYHVLVGFIVSMTITGCPNSDSDESTSTAVGRPQTLAYQANYAELKNSDAFGYGSSVAASDDGQLVAGGSSNQRLQCPETPVTEDSSNCTKVNELTGSVEIFDRQNNKTYLLQSKLNTTNLKFGHSTSMTADGRWLAVGAPSDSLSHTTTTCQGIILETDFGTLCNMQENDVNLKGYQAGAVYLFQHDASNQSWALHSVIKQANAASLAMNYHRFGEKVAFSRDGTSLVIAPLHDRNPFSGSATQPTTSPVTGDDLGSIYVYAMDPDNGTLNFKYYHQISGHTNLGKRLHSRPNDVLVASNQHILLVKAAMDAGTGITLLKDIHLDTDLQLAITNLSGVEPIVFRANKLYLGLGSLSSDCTGVVTANQFPIDKSSMQACLNQAGVNNMGGVLVYDVNSSNQPYTDQLSAIILPEVAGTSLTFGRDLVVSEDGTQLFIGYNDDKDCTKVMASRASGCSSAGTIAHTGAIQQYYQTQGTWSMGSFIKPRSIGNTTPTPPYFGKNQTMYQFKEHLYFKSEMKSVCAGRTEAADEDTCPVDPVLLGMISQYKLM